MRIIIVGAGKVGQTLCDDLSHDGYDIVLIEKNEDVLQRDLATYDVSGIVGDGTDYNVLKEADVAHADVFVSVATDDEINVISCIMAKHMGAKYTIARVRQQKYESQHEFLCERIGIDHIINPESSAAKSILKLLEFTPAKNYDVMADGRIAVIEKRIDSKSFFVGKPLLEIRKQLGMRLLIGVIKRGDEIFIPKGDFVVHENDMAYIFGKKDELMQVFEVKKMQKGVHSVLIIGAGRVTYYLLKLLSKYHMDIKVIEKDKEAAKLCAEKFPQVTVIWGDGTDQEILDEERIASFDAVISATGIDEENILVSVYAQKCGVKKTITKVNRLSLLSIIDPDMIQATITPKQIISDNIIQIVRTLIARKTNSPEKVLRFADKRIEILQFTVLEDDHTFLGKSIEDLRVQDDCLIAFIIRKRQVFIPKEQVFVPEGTDKLEVGDTLIVVSKGYKTKNLEDILQ